MTEGESDTQIFNPAEAYLLTLSSRQSVEKMRRVLNGIAAVFGYENLRVCPWERMTYDAVLAFRAKRLGEDLAPATINLQLAAIRQVAKQAWLKGLMSVEMNAAIQEVKCVRGSRVPKGRALSLRESGRLIDASENKQTAIGTRDAALMGLAIACGLRRTELAELRLSNIDHVNKRLRIIGKGNKERIVTPQPEAWELLESWLKLRGEGGCLNVFVAVKKGSNMKLYWPMSANAIYQILRLRAKESSVAAFTPHDLRRTFATRLLDAGADINTVREAMGHASVVTTQRYDKRDKERVTQFTTKIPL